MLQVGIQQAGAGPGMILAPVFPLRRGWLGMVTRLGVVKSYSCVVSWAGLYGVISFSHGVTKDIHSKKQLRRANITLCSRYRLQLPSI